MKFLPVKVQGDTYEITFLPDGRDEWIVESYTLGGGHYGEHEDPWAATVKDNIDRLVAEIRLRFPETSEKAEFHDAESGAKVPAKTAEKAFAAVREEA